MILKDFRGKEWIIFIISILTIIDLAVLFNISFMRQIFGFIFLTILPGLLILRILKLKIDFTEMFVLSVGLSISFLMFFGLLLNNSSLNLGYETPLATIPLLISFNIAFVVLAIIGYKINKDQIFSLPNLNLTTAEKAFLIVPVLFPALSIFGMHLMRTTDNNIILMLLLFLIPIYVVFVCFFNQKFPERLYPVVIYLISISVILMIALRSDHLIGVDVQSEYYFFQTTFDNKYWSVFGHSPLDACLSISLLPTIYQLFLNVDSERLFNVLYVILFSLLPLIVFVISKKYIGDFYGFFASLLFISQARFIIYAIEGVRTPAAILFFALAMMTLFNDKIDPLKKRILFIVFMASCMVSHYSTTYVFFCILLGAFVGMEILSKKYTFKKVISLTLVLLFFGIIFFWYSQVTETAFNAGVGFIENTLSNLNKFFIEETRGQAQALLGEGIWQKGIPHKIEFVFTWLTLAFIGIGILTLIRRYKEMSFPELNFKKPEFLKDKFEVGYFMIALACSGLLVAMVALPYVAVGYSMDRLYGVAISILGVFFVIGGIMLSRYTKVRAYLIILLVLIPYFLSVSGVTYQMFGYQRAIILNSEGEQYDLYYVHDQESCSAKWLGNYADEKAKMYADFHGSRRLLSQGKIRSPQYDFHWLSYPDVVDGYIYLRYSNIMNGELIGRYNKVYNMVDYQDLFLKTNKIYSNGGSEVWR